MRAQKPRRRITQIFWLNGAKSDGGSQASSVMRAQKPRRGITQIFWLTEPSPSVDRGAIIVEVVKAETLSTIGESLSWDIQAHRC